MHKLHLSISTISLILFSAIPALASRPESVPDWGRAAAQQKLPVYPPDTNAVIRRDYLIGEIFFKTDEYADLRSFYSNFENKDQETVVLTTAPAPAKPTPAGN